MRPGRARFSDCLLLVIALALGLPLSASAATNEITTVAGTGSAGFAGDLGPATGAQLNLPVGVTATADGGYLIADQSNNRIRRVAPGGVITTVAGNGTAGFGGDGGPATAAQLNAPSGAIAMPDGGLLIADTNNNRIRRVAPNGTISTVAGTGAATFGGDGGPATSAQIAFPFDVALTADGGYLIADVDNNRVRKVSSGGTIDTVAGSALQGFAGDGGPATAAQLSDPSGVAVTPDGGFLIAETGNDRIRRVAPDGTITTAAGNGIATFAGDGGPATAASLNDSARVAVTPDGGFVIADRQNNRIRKVSADGTISTIAGAGAAGFDGDGVLASSAQINGPLGLSVTGEGDVLIADTFNQRVRHVDAADAQAPTDPALPAPVAGKTVNVERVAGAVKIKCKRDRKFAGLEAAASIAVGCVVDTRRGTVELTSSKGKGRGTQSARFWDGVFRIGQKRGNAEVTLTLVGKLSCGKRRPAARRRNARDSTAGAELSRKRGRKLWGRGKGRFKTVGKHGSASVRGTTWLVADRCDDSTLFQVRRGVVSVRDFAERRTLTLRKGKRHVADGKSRR